MPLLSLAPSPDAGIANDVTIDVAVPNAVSGDIAGKGEIDNIGMVSFTAEQQGNRIVFHALDSAGIVAGRAEVTRGLKQTPLHISTPDDLQKITLRISTD